MRGWRRRALLYRGARYSTEDLRKVQRHARAVVYFEGMRWQSIEDLFPFEPLTPTHKVDTTRCRRRTRTRSRARARSTRSSRSILRLRGLRLPKVGGATRRVRLVDTNTPPSYRLAYRKRALRTHPDRGGDEGEFKQIAQ